MDFKYDIEKCDVANKAQLAEYHQILSDWHNWMGSVAKTLSS